MLGDALGWNPALRRISADSVSVGVSVSVRTAAAGPWAVLQGAPFGYLCHPLPSQLLGVSLPRDQFSVFIKVQRGDGSQTRSLCAGPAVLPVAVIKKQSSTACL